MSWSERNEEADAQEDGAGDHQVPDGDEERATELLAHLRDAAAVEDAARARDGGVEGAELRGGEEAREDAPEHALDGMGVEHGQGVVDLHEQGGFLVQDHHREPRDADHVCTSPAPCKPTWHHHVFMHMCCSVNP